MVFARLTPADKDAFFALLDEYFASRPELFGSGANGAAGRAAAASVAAQVLSAPPVPASNGWRRPEPPASSTADIGSSVGRVAAAAAALRASGQGIGLAAAEPGTPTSNGYPRPPPRRTNTSSSGEEPEQSRAVPIKKFGGNLTANKITPPPQAAPPQRGFAPPPRRVPSGSGGSPVPPPALPRRQTQETGEWAEALYDYQSEDPGDLELQEGVRVLVVEKTSDDWWTGEIDGRRGLVPAAYIKVL